MPKFFKIKCTKCQVEKWSIHFSKDPHKKNLKSSWCKPCVRNTVDDRYRKRREWMNELKSKPCVDCGGEFPPCCMDFDHDDPNVKKFSIALGLMGNLERLQEELAKCQVICSNCHRIRTWLGGKRRKCGRK